MSITSSNNLAVNNSLTVNGNSTFGVDNTSTVICNSKPTFNSDVTISGNVTQSSGTFSTGSGNVNLNGDVVINGTKKLTTGTGDTTINGLLKCNGNINNVGTLTQTGAATFNSLSATSINNSGTYNTINCSAINNSGTLTQNGTVSCNTINCSSINNSGTLTQNGTVSCNAINCTSINNSGTWTQTGAATFNALSATSINNSGSYNAINCSSINNTGILSTSNLELLSSTSPAYIDMKTSGNNTDFDVRIATSGGAVGTAGQGTLTISSASTVINSPISTNSSLSVSGTSNLSGILYTANGITNSNAAIVNNSTLTQVGTSVFADVVRVSPGKSLYISDNTFTNYLRMHHTGTGGNSVIDFTGNMLVRNSGTTTPISIDGGTNQITFSSNLNTTGITNSGILTQNSTCNINSGLNVSGLPKFDGASTQTLPSTNTGANSGLAVYWNAEPSHNRGETCFLNMAQGGPGGFTFYSSNSNTGTSGIPRKLMYLDDQSNLSSINNLSCSSLTTSTSISTPSMTCANNSMFPGGINNSLYYSVKGSTYNNSTATTAYYYIKYDGNSGSSASESFQMNSYAICAKITYSYYSDFPSNTYQGSSEYVVYGANFSAVSMAWSVGALQYQPTITCSSTGLITVTFAKNIALTGHITWSVGVLII